MQFTDSLSRVLAWAHARDDAGYSKFDAFNSRLVNALVPRSRRVRAVVTAVWSRLPVSLRPLVGTTRSRNPKGVALFALAYLRRHRVRGDEGDLERAVDLLDWLDEHDVRGYSGKCWGYDHDWYGLHFYAPKDSPNVVVTGNVLYAFLEATGEERYLAAARSGVDSYLNDLAAPVDTPQMRSIGYVPGSDWGVLNVNGLAAAILIWVWQHTGESRLREEAGRLIAFLVDKQTGYGAWHYAWPAGTSNVRHDNYHTGNVLDWVLDYCRRSGDGRFLPNFERGLAFYREHLFLADGAPRWMSHRTYPFDAHSAGQGIVTFAKAALEFDAGCLADARRVARWAVGNLQAPGGCFCYQRGRFWTKRYTFMRWCNSWMAYGLSSLLLAEDELAGRAA